MVPHHNHEGLRDLVHTGLDDLHYIRKVPKKGQNQVISLTSFQQGSPRDRGRKSLAARRGAQLAPCHSYKGPRTALGS